MRPCHGRTENSHQNHRRFRRPAARRPAGGDDADRLGEVRAEVAGEKAKDEPSRVETFNVRLEIAGDLDAATKQRILEDAENICTVSNTLRGSPAMHATLG